jgi:hypothetical protein
MRFAVGIVVAGIVALALGVPPALANGRNPHTVGIYTKKGDAQTLYVATTFGLAISHDGGCTFHWLCEQNIGYGGTWDPTYGVTPDGTIFATTFEGLRISRDGGCTFTTAASTANLWIDALTIGPTGEIWIGTAETAGMNDVFASTDNGVTFTSRGMASAEKWWKSVVIAPSDPARVYITGYQVAGTPTAYFYRSDNSGTDWTPSPLANVMYAGTPVLRVRAVDPANKDIVYMSSEASNPPSGDRLYRSTDGGATWTEVLAASAAIHDVLVRDAQTVFVATQIRTTTSLVGGPTYKSVDGGVTFTQLSGVPEMACLTQDANGDLLGCGANWEPDFKAIARSTDGGATWTKQWRFIEMADALQCPAGTEQHDTCDVSLWDCTECLTDLKRQFGATGPTCGVAATDSPAPKKSSGCCGVGDPVGVLWAVLVGVALVLTRRRRTTR